MYAEGHIKSHFHLCYIKIIHFHSKIYDAFVDYVDPSLVNGDIQSDFLSRKSSASSTASLDRHQLRTQTHSASAKKQVKISFVMHSMLKVCLPKGLCIVSELYYIT